MAPRRRALPNFISLPTTLLCGLGELQFHVRDCLTAGRRARKGTSVAVAASITVVSPQASARRVEKRRATHHLDGCWLLLAALALPFNQVRGCAGSSR